MLSKKFTAIALSLIAAVSLQAQHPYHDPFDDPFFQDPFGDDIFKEMLQMQRQMDEMFARMQQRINQRTARLIHPSMGMYKLSAQGAFVDKGDRYELVTNIPESKENRIDIRTQNGMLSVSAKIVHEEKQTTNGMVSTSRSIQSFNQSLTLPNDADESAVSSSFKNGRLVISVAKKKTVSAASTATAPAKPKVEKTQEKPVETKSEKETALPKIDEKLKKQQPAAASSNALKAQESAPKPSPAL